MEARVLAPTVKPQADDVGAEERLHIRMTHEPNELSAIRVFGLTGIDEEEADERVFDVATGARHDDARQVHLRKGFVRERSALRELRRREGCRTRWHVSLAPPEDDP